MWPARCHPSRHRIRALPSWISRLWPSGYTSVSFTTKSVSGASADTNSDAVTAPVSASGALSGGEVKPSPGGTAFVYVNVPESVGPGDTFRLCLQSQGSASRQFRIRVPPNHTPGTRLRVELPAKGGET